MTRDSVIRCALTWATITALAPSAIAQLQFDELRKEHLPADSNDTYAVAVGDVDGDGDSDMVFGNYRQQNRLYLNDGSGAFTDATAGRMPVDVDRTSAVAMGDVDGDGDADLVFGNDYDGLIAGGQNRLYLNDGTGAFTDATAAQMPIDRDSTLAVTLGDVDGDGDADLVFGNFRQQNRLYLNDGTGTFTDATAARMPTDSGPATALAMGDVDGDGDPDLILGNRGFRNRLYLNDGTGTFTNVPDKMPNNFDGTLAVDLGDVDGDGDLDVVFANGFSSFNGVVEFQNRLYVNDGTGTFTDATATRMPPDSDLTHAVALGDVDGDGDRDLVFGNFRLQALVPGEFSPQNCLYLNDGTGIFTDSTAAHLPSDSDGTRAVELGDVNGDGDADLIFGNFPEVSTSTGQNRLYLNDDTGTFIDATAARMPSDLDGGWAVALGDVDGDGDNDLVFASGQNSLYLNDGTGTFTNATAGRIPPDGPYNYTASVAIGDVDGDGDLDLVLGQSFNHQTRLYLNDGTGTFTDATTARMPLGGGSSVALGDVDGDGDPDIALGIINGGVRLFLNDSTGTFTDVSRARMPIEKARISDVVFCDVDRDGDPDLVFGSWGDGARLYVNNSTGVFTDVTSARMPPDSYFTVDVVLGDMDGDGDEDLVLANASSAPQGRQNRLYLNNGTGTFTDTTAGRMPTDTDYTRAVALGDVDGDGDPDLVFGNGPVSTDLVFGNKPHDGPGQNRLYLNDGTGNFTDATAARIASDTDGTVAVALGDLDGDGDPDLVFGNIRTFLYETREFRGGPSRLYLNLHRHVHTPLFPILSRTLATDFYAKPGYGTSYHVAIPALNLALAPTPLTVPPFGDIHLAITNLIYLPWVHIPPTTGKATMKIVVPADPSLVGQTVYVQALIASHDDPGDAHFTNYTADVIIK